MSKYNPQEIESKWQKNWEKEKTFSVDLKEAKKPYYNLMMFPYPSAEGLHVGNVYAFTGSDIHGRFRRLQGYDVFEPMGFDAFGIHSENFAIKKNIHPAILVKSNVKHFKEDQLKKLGALFDWEHQVDTTDPEYYKWTQWLFLQLYKNKLAVRKTAAVDWCPHCQTVLADEQVIDGRCERCSTEVIQKELKQWFFKITNYAERLLKNLEWIDWPSTTKTMQKNWIGKSEGVEIEFKISSNEKEVITIYTTRPDTIYGVTFVSISPEHPLVEKLTKEENKPNVEMYIKKAKHKTELERTSLEKEKTGVFTGSYVINQISKESVPVYVADYVLMTYGTGAVMGVPAHDQRDFEFASKYNISIKKVIKTQGKDRPVSEDKAFTNYGVLVDSGEFTGQTSEEAIKNISEYIESNHLGRKKVNYHLRDWLISRQRYWGPPIPIIYCAKCGTVPVPEKDLPVLLPHVENFRPTGTGKSPLGSVLEFVNTTCPNCGGAGKRETDVSDTFLDSSWYFLRYLSTEFDDRAFDDTLTKKWLPVDMYIGGNEHAVLHLMYTRFITMVLKDLGFIDFEEPFKKFRAHGLITKEGAKMSKSKGNVVNPDEYFQTYGADTVRTYLMFLGPYNEGGDWSDRGIQGVWRFLNRVWSLGKLKRTGQTDQEKFLVQKTAKKVTNDTDSLHYNTAIASLMELTNYFVKAQTISEAGLKTLLQLLSPFAPHQTEEMWHLLGEKDSIHNQKWPDFASFKTQPQELYVIVQVDGKMRDKLQMSGQEAKNKEKVQELALKSEKVKKHLAGKKISKVIYVEGKILSLVTLGS